jgi:hypothetical protein
MTSRGVYASGRPPLHVCSHMDSPRLKEAVLGLQVPEQGASQAHPREAAQRGPLRPQRRSGC